MRLVRRAAAKSDRRMGIARSQAPSAKRRAARRASAWPVPALNWAAGCPVCRSFTLLVTTIGHRFTRRELYDLVWSEPVRVPAQRFQLFDVGFVKICRKAGIPSPPRAWALKEADWIDPLITPENGWLQD